MSNKRIDALLEEFNERGSIVHQVVSPPITYLVVKLDHLMGIGYMACIPEDEFSVEYGLKNALRKALKNIHEQRRTLSAIKGINIPVVMDYSEVVEILMPENDSLTRLNSVIGTSWIIQYKNNQVSCVVTRGFMPESKVAMVEIHIEQGDDIFLLPLRQLEVVGRRIIEEV